MGILDFLKGNQHKDELNALREENEQLKELLTPEMQDVITLKKQLSLLQDTIKKANADINSKKLEVKDLDGQIKEKKKMLVSLDESLFVEEFGLYKPQFDFASSLDFKEALSAIRHQQKELIKKNKAVKGYTDWTVSGSLAKGKKMVSDTQKLLLRAFNSECDDLVSKVRYTNFDASLEKLKKSAENISKLGSIMGINITSEYLSAKIKELRLALEYQLKKQKEKEELQAARAEQREQAKIEREIAEQRKKLDKEQTHYQTAYEKICQQVIADPNNQELLQKQKELEKQLSDIEHAINDVDYRAANIKAGYVYVISNIGAFGENVYKIGMTRRLEPMDRIYELGDASVPFNFDVHAMIFSDDAPGLEAALHRAFEAKKLNMVNHRREFFRVTLDEIKDVIKRNFDKTVEFTDIPDAEQYRVSLRMKKQQEKPALA